MSVSNTFTRLIPYRLNGLLCLCLMPLLTSCATTKPVTVKFPQLPPEIIGVREYCTLPVGQITNADLADAYADCATKLKKANIRLDAIQSILREQSNGKNP